MRGLRYIGITHRATNDLSHSLAATAFDRPGFAAPARAFITHKVTNDNILSFPSGQFPSFSLGKIQGFSKTEENLCNIFINNRLRSICENYPSPHDWFPPFGANVEVDPEIASKYELNKIANSKAPEVLFIEACYNFLKPGGKMGIVLPDGILGNPNMEKVRIWILQHFKLLASIDLPVETFLPQVGVQASLLFLQKKTAQEELISFEEENYDVFMAVVDKVGKDRRGVPIFKKDDDGAELLFDENRQWITSDGKVRQRNIRIKKVDDDLPDIVKAYKDFIRN